ncbi:MAG: YqaJ viral recombinase family protein [Thermoplasmata archaeon]|nr:YqaJ viral recombinase family protein [Thermoplasmata archaeon]
MLTQEQIQDRINGIGGSEAASVLGLSRYKTTLQLWGEKTGQLPVPEIDSEAAELGSELEDYVARRFTKKTGLQVERVNETIIHPNYNFLRANIDRRVVGENSILECKTCSIRKSQEWIEDEIPQEYLIQVHHYLMVTGAEIAYIAVLIGNEKFLWKIVERDENIIQQILQGELNFWNNFVLTRTMPMTIGANDAETLLALFPNSEPLQSVELDDEANRLIEFRNALILDSYSLETQIEAHNNQIKALLGNAEKGESNLFKAIWKSQSRKSIDVESLKQQNPRIYNQYLRTTNSRSLKITSKVISQGVGTNESE